MKVFQSLEKEEKVHLFLYRVSLITSKTRMLEIIFAGAGYFHEQVWMFRLWESSFYNITCPQASAEAWKPQYITEV